MTQIPIAFYAPLKPPDHPNPSGDRHLARLLLAALGQAGFAPQLASRFRSYDRAGDSARQQRLRALGGRLAERLLRQYEALPAAARPALWFTYHLYHKAPDWIGPAVSRALGIPYVAAEASYAPKQSRGPWQTGLQGSLDAVRDAACLFNLNPADRDCLLRLTEAKRLVQLPPFLDLTPYRTPPPSQRQALASALDLNPELPWLVCTAMMRPGDKLASYRMLADAVTALRAPCTLLVIGDGRARREVEQCFHGYPDVRFLGALPPQQALPVLASCDLYAWPAVNEAFGMALLEAQASGLPVLAGAEGGVASILPPNLRALQTPARDTLAFTERLETLLSDRARLAELGRQARAHVLARHGIDQAAASLRQHLGPLLPSPLLPKA